MKNKYPINSDKLTPDYESRFEPKEGDIEVIHTTGKWYEVHKKMGNNVITISLTKRELKELYYSIHEVIYA